MLYPEPINLRPLDAQDVQVWNLYWGDVARRIGPAFARAEARTCAMAYLSGLLSPVERKNSWQLAEITGAPNPYRMQHVLGRADWDPDDLRDQLRRFVLDYLADPDAIGVLDETGFLKKGTHSVGVARQYSGTAGRVENCQIGVFLTYASVHGHSLLDRALYLPTAWTDDPARCQLAGVPDDRRFATKPELARQLLARAAADGVTCAWITGDKVYGDDRPLRQWLEAQQQASVMGAASTEQLWVRSEAWTLAALLRDLADVPWERHSCGAGSQGPRWDAWQRIELSAPAQPGWKRWVRFRRSWTTPEQVTAYRAFAPAATTLAAQAVVVGTRWTVEASFQTAKAEVGLDQYEVRSWTGWYRHITLALWAQAFLAVIRHVTGAPGVPQKGGLPPTGPSSLTRFKTRRGLPCGYVVAKSGACFGRWSSRSNGKATLSCTGHGGAAGTKRWRHGITPDGGALWAQRAWWEAPRNRPSRHLQGWSGSRRWSGSPQTSSPGCGRGWSHSSRRSVGRDGSPSIIGGASWRPSCM